MANAPSRRLAGASATLLVAIGSAAYLVLGSDAQGLPACCAEEPPTPLETPMLLIRNLGDRLAGALLCWTEARPDDLRCVDARTLADIGIDARDVASIEARRLDLHAATRLRFVEATCHD